MQVIRALKIIVPAVLALGFAPISATAATTAEAFIDWNTLSIETTGDIELVLTNPFVNNVAKAFDLESNNLDVTASLLGPTSVDVPGVGSATGGSPAGAYGFASAINGLLEATSLQGNLYGISGTGTVTASVDYSILLDEPVGPVPQNPFGGVNLFIEFYENAESPFASVAVADIIDLFSFTGSGQQSLMGTLSATIEILNTTDFSGIAIYGDLQVDAVTNVIPVPAAAWLFGSALGLLGWIRHRQT